MTKKELIEDLRRYYKNWEVGVAWEYDRCGRIGNINNVSMNGDDIVLHVDESLDVPDKTNFHLVKNLASYKDDAKVFVLWELGLENVSKLEEVVSLCENGQSIQLNANSLMERIAADEEKERNKDVRYN